VPWAVIAIIPLDASFLLIAGRPEWAAGVAALLVPTLLAVRSSGICSIRPMDDVGSGPTP